MISNLSTIITRYGSRSSTTLFSVISSRSYSISTSNGGTNTTTTTKSTTSSSKDRNKEAKRREREEQDEMRQTLTRMRMKSNSSGRENLNKMLRDLKDDDSEINTLLFKKNQQQPPKITDSNNSISSNNNNNESENIHFNVNKKSNQDIILDERISKESQRAAKGELEDNLIREKNPHYYKEIAPGIAINPALSTIDSGKVVVSSSLASGEAVEKARELADRFGLSYMEWSALERLPTNLCTYSLVLFVEPTGIVTLNDLEMFESKKGSLKRKMTCQVSLDFTKGAINFKTAKGTYAKSPLVRSVKCPKQPGYVLDVTGGLAKDAWILATFGSRVTVVERNPILQYFIESALEKAKEYETTRHIAERINLVKMDSVEYLVSIINNNKSTQPDVIFMDPMYQTKEAEEKIKALSKKDIRAIRKLVGGDRDSKLLFALSKRIAQKRIVWKKPKSVPPVVGVDTSYKSSDTRFDVVIVNKELDQTDTSKVDPIDVDDRTFVDKVEDLDEFQDNEEDEAEEENISIEEEEQEENENESINELEEDLIINEIDRRS